MAKIIKSDIKINKIPIVVTSIITTMTDEPLLIVSKSLDGPEYDKTNYAKYELANELIGRSDSFIDAFYSSRRFF